MTSSSRDSSIPLGSYQLRERIGEGGTAHVHRAVAQDGRRVAIKLLAPQAELDDPNVRARFDREIRILASVHDRHLVELLDHGVDPELGPYLVMPEVPGQTLRELLTGKRLCPEAVLLLLWPLLGAVEALHAAGLVHRDLKPENLIMDPDGQLVLVDLGLAYGPGHTRYTDEGTVVGSVPYMSPEQVEGRPVLAASDLWAVGVMAYEWLTGRRPFARERPAEEAAALLVGAFVPVAVAERRASPELGALVSDCLRPDPAARPSASLARERVRALVDFADLGADAQTERAALFRDPTGYQARIAEFRVAQLRHAAAAAIAGGESFRALAAIDRGLAYAPGDAELLSLSERAEHAGASTRGADRPGQADGVSVPAAPPRSDRRRAMLAITGLLAAAGIAAGIALRESGPEAPGANSVPGATTSAGAGGLSTEDQRIDTALRLMGGVVELVGDRVQEGGEVRTEGDPEQAKAALALFGGIVNLATAQIEADRKGAPARPDEASPPSPASVEVAQRDAPLALIPIPLDALVDRPARADLGLAAGAGEPLVPVDLLSGLDPEETAEMYDRKVAAHPDDPAWGTGRALVYLAAGRKAAGLRLLEALLARYPRDPGVWAVKGYVDLRRGRYAEGEAAFTRALEIAPNDGQSLRNRGILRHRKGQLRDAYRDLVAAVEQDPRDVEAMSELARIYEDADRRPDAEPLLARIVALRPDSVVAWMDLSLVQPPAQALVSVEHALALAPDSPDVLARACQLGAQPACEKLGRSSSPK